MSLTNLSIVQLRSDEIKQSDWMMQVTLVLVYEDLRFPNTGLKCRNAENLPSFCSGQLRRNSFQITEICQITIC